MKKKIIADNTCSSKQRETAKIALQSVIHDLITKMHPFVRDKFVFSEADLVSWFEPYAVNFKTERDLSDFLIHSFKQMLEYLPAAPFALDDFEVEGIKLGFERMNVHLEMMGDSSVFQVVIVSYGVGWDKQDLLETSKLAMKMLASKRDRVKIILVGVDKQGDILARPFDVSRFSSDPLWQQRIEYRPIYGDIRDKDYWDTLSKDISANVILFRYNWTKGSVDQNEFVNVMGKSIPFGFIVAKQDGLLQRDIQFFVNGRLTEALDSSGFN